MKKTALLLAGSLLAAATAQAESALSYQNLSVGYIKAELDAGAVDVDFSGLGFAGSMPVSDNIFVTASFIDIESDDSYRDITSGQTDEFNASALSFGAGFHAAISDNTDMVFSLTLDDIEIKHGNRSADDTGHTLSLGVRSKPNAQVEIEAALAHSEIDDETENGVALSGRFFLTPKASLGLTWEDSDDSTAQTIDIRFDF